MGTLDGFSFDSPAEASKLKVTIHENQLEKLFHIISITILIELFLFSDLQCIYIVLIQKVELISF